MKKLLKDFKDFAVKGNMIDLAVGVIIGAAFNSIVQSLVKDVIMPAISVFTGKIDFTNLFIALDGNTYETLAAAQEVGAATINYGSFITNLINFLIEAFVIFIMVRQVAKMRKKEEPAAPAAPTTKKCPYCMSEIDMNATKCPHCTSVVE